jgi:hypothetical protein
LSSFSPSLQHAFAKHVCVSWWPYKPRETPSLPLCFAQFSRCAAKVWRSPQRIGAEARLNVDRKKVDIVSVQDHFVSREVRLIVSIPAVNLRTAYWHLQSIYLFFRS